MAQLTEDAYRRRVFRSVEDRILRALNEIELGIRALIEPQVAAGALSAAEALVRHRHAHWILLARRFASSVDYVVEDR